MKDSSLPLKLDVGIKTKYMQWHVEDQMLYEVIYSALKKKPRDFGDFPYKTAIFEWEFWALKDLPSPWPPGSKQCEIGSFQKGTTCPVASRGCKVNSCQSFSTWKKNQVFIGGAVFIWQYLRNNWQSIDQKFCQKC